MSVSSTSKWNHPLFPLKKRKDIHPTFTATKYLYFSLVLVLLYQDAIGKKTFDQFSIKNSEYTQTQLRVVILLPYGPMKRSRAQVSTKLVNYCPFGYIIPVRNSKADNKKKIDLTVQSILCWSLLYFIASINFFFRSLCEVVSFCWEHCAC